MKQILVELQETMGGDASIANAAWNSTYDKARRDIKYDDPKEVERMVKQIITDRHGVPVESVQFRFWIRMPIFADRQHMTHRIASHNGLSGRYRTMPLDYYELPNDAKEILLKLDSTSFGVGAAYNQSCDLAVENYKKSIETLKDHEKRGIITNAEFKRVRELVRAQLPTAGMVERTTIMNLRSFVNYQHQRNSSYAQPEIKQVAKLMLDEVKKNGIAPIAIATLESMGWKL